MYSGSRPQRINVDIRCPDIVRCAAFLVDGQHIVSGAWDEKIRRWRLDDGGEVGPPMDAGDQVYSIAVSQDGGWIVSGTTSGLVQLWNAETREKVGEIQGHRDWVGAVDISADGTRIVTGADDKTVCVWSLRNGNRLFGPWKHEHWVAAAKFSPDGRLVATATWERRSVRVYDSQDSDDRCLFEVPVQIGSWGSNSLAWSSDGKLLFALSHDGTILSLDATTGKTRAEWTIHSTTDARCIALASNDTFIVASASSSVSLWDTATQQQIGSIVEFNHPVTSLAISDTHALASGGEYSISIRYLGDILPITYTWHVADIRPETFIELRTAQHAAEERNKLLHDENVQLKATNEKLHRNLTESQYALEEQRTQTESWKMKANDENAMLERANQELQCLIRVHEKKYQFEALYAQDRTFDAAKKLLEIESSADEYITSNEFLSEWLTGSMSRCSKTLEKNGDDALNAGKPEAVSAYAAALSLGCSDPYAILAKWAGAALANYSAREALGAGVEFKASRFSVYRAVCIVLEGTGRISEAVEIFQQMQYDLRDTDVNDERTRWEHDFRECGVAKLVNLADAARDSKKHEEAIQYYSDAISLDPTNLHQILLQRGNELIKLDSSSYKGYEEKHRALHGMGCYSKAFDAFRVMLETFERSRDPEIRELRHQYVDVTPAIQKEVEKAVRNLPTVLIDTDTGRLYDKTQQKAAFEELPIYDELRSSMTRVSDHARIRKEVTAFYRYVMFSHKWQSGEPTFQQVENDSVYSLPSSQTFDKLRNFCKLVVALRYKWAWSDTCCVNQLDRGVQQESIVAMFRWYRRSSLTLVHLLGVLSESQVAGCLWKSIWNTRGWTYQEYVASEVVQFYTEDWKPYLDLQMFNHKESPVVLSEMKQATNIATQQLISIKPGLDRAREKLYLASGRQTEREEDMAYSLFGIFDVALQVVYGEGNQAIGRLLEYILTRSDDVTLLAWTGHSGSHHSYLPASLTVYNEIVPLHVPGPIEVSEMDRKVRALRSSIPDFSGIVNLYQRLHDLPRLSLVGGYLKLPGVVFRLDGFSSPSESNPESNIHVYRTTTPILGDVEIKTTADLSGMRGLRLIHPWIRPLIDQDFSFDDALFDLPTRALRLLVRLRQPFGGLLLASSSGRSQYRRVATDSFIRVRVREEAPLGELLDAVRTVDIH